ncbi:MAG: hypothetical protein ACT443_03160, partial [Gemmatimonadota bacterium]
GRILFRLHSLARQFATHASVPGFRNRTSVAHGRMISKVLLDEARAQVNVDLYQRAVANAAKAVDLSRFDDEDVTGARLEFLAVDVPYAAAFPDELDLIVRVAMRAGSAALEAAEEKHGDVDVTVIGSDEVVRAPPEREIGLFGSVHWHYSGLRSSPA